jgi:hypothetical protein
MPPEIAVVGSGVRVTMVPVTLAELLLVLLGDGSVTEVGSV